jgi:hypothetical protein
MSGPVDGDRAYEGDETRNWRLIWVIPPSFRPIAWKTACKKTPGRTGRKLRRLSAEEFAKGCRKVEERITGQYFVMMKFRACFLHFRQRPANDCMVSIKIHAQAKNRVTY